MYIYFIENRLTLMYGESRRDNIYLGKCANRHYIFTSRSAYGSAGEFSAIVREDLSLSRRHYREWARRSENERALRLHNLKSDPHNYLQMPYRYRCGAGINFHRALSVSASYNPTTSPYLVTLWGKRWYEYIYIYIYVLVSSYFFSSLFSLTTFSSASPLAKA